MTKLENPVQMAVIGAAHGIKGEVRVRAFTTDPLALGGYGPLQAADGCTFEIASIRPAGDVSVVRFKGISTRNEAEALNGIALFIDRSALPSDLDEEEYYHADLVGLGVRDEGGAEIGAVVAIHDFGAGDILEVKRGNGAAAMIPFTRAAVPEVAPEKGFVRIDRIAAGLVDAEAADDEEKAAGEATRR